MLGFAMRAGRLILGTEQVCAAMAQTGAKQPHLILLCPDASEGTKKKITVKAAFYGIDLTEIPMDSSALGHLLGKAYTPMTAAVTDARFAEEIRRAAESVQDTMKGSFRGAETGDTDGSGKN